jgi:hypothetical protein
MELKDLREKIFKDVDSCFMVKDNEVHEFKIALIKGEKSISGIYAEEPHSFSVGLENPHNKKIWKPDYAMPFIDIMGIDDNGELALTDYKQAGYDVPNAWFTIKGDFFLTKCSAEKFINR